MTLICVDSENDLWLLPPKCQCNTGAFHALYGGKQAIWTYVAYRAHIALKG
jgi:hypothetical protein